MKRWALAVALALAAASPFATAALPCGYHSPEMVALGALNWVYPKALYVRTAVWQAEDVGILPARAAKPAIDMFAFHRISAALQKLGEHFNAAEVTADDRQGFSIVLIGSVLWTRFVLTSSGYDVQVHADGPIPGDVVIVSDGKVIRALVEGMITPQIAREHGLIRFYGPPHLIAAVSDRLDRISVSKQTTGASLSGSRD